MQSHHLALVRGPPPEPEEPVPEPGPDPALPDRGETALVASLFALNLVPIVGEAVDPGGWSPAIVAFAALAALLTGRELWSQLRARRRARSGS